jgi:hypothetical protein
VVQFHAGRQQRFLAAGRNRPRSDVPADIKARIIDPDRRTGAEAGPVEPLAEPRRQVQPLLDPGPDRLKGQFSRCIEQSAALEDGEGGHVHRQAMLLDAKVADVERSKPLDNQTVSTHVGSRVPGNTRHRNAHARRQPNGGVLRVSHWRDNPLA